MSRHNVWIPDDLWVRAERAAYRLSLLTGERVTVSELIRRGLEQAIRSAESREGADRVVAELQDVQERIRRLEQLREGHAERLAVSPPRSPAPVAARPLLDDLRSQIDGLVRRRRSLAERIVERRGSAAREGS